MNKFIAFTSIALASLAFAADPYVPETPKLDSDGCYAISSVEELYGFAKIVNASKTHDECGKLTEDLIVSTYDWYSSDEERAWKPIPLFRGVFDGQNHTIEGLHYAVRDSSNLGMFAELRGFMSDDGKSVEKPAVVKNLGLFKTEYIGLGCLGGVAGKASAAEILNSYNQGALEATSNAGGLVGCANHVKIGESYSETYIYRSYLLDSSFVAFGGLVGYNEGSLSIENSYNLISSHGDIFGSFVGSSNGKLNIANSISYIKDVIKESDVKKAFPLVGEYREDETVVENVFYWLPEDAEWGPLGIAAPNDDFKYGTVVQRLRDYNKNDVDGSVWGQMLYADSLPQLSGTLLMNSYKSNWYDSLKTLEIKAPKMVDDCYQIGSAEELYGFALIANANASRIVPVCGKLTKDIVVNKNVLLNDTLGADAKELIPWVRISNFSGTFDGAGHTISGLYFDETEYREISYERKAENVGFIGSVKNLDPLHDVRIENLGIKDSYFNGSSSVGAIVGMVLDSSSTVVIKNCYSTSYVMGNFYVGLVGTNYGDSLVIEQSYNKGIVNHTDKNLFNTKPGGAGGLIGNAVGTTLILNSYSVASIRTDNEAGLLAGRMGSAYNLRLYEGSRIYVVNSFGLDPYAQEKAMQPRPVVASVDTRDAPVFVNAFSEKTEKEVNVSYRVKGKFLVSSVDADLFKDGTVATLLHNYVAAGQDGLVWGQKVGTDDYPVFSGSVSATIALSDLKLVTFPEDTVKYFNKYKEGVATGLPIPVKKDDVFGGWYASADFSGEAIKAIPADAKGPQTFYAKWVHYPLLVDGCYEIANASELYLFKEIVDSLSTELCAKLTADIVVNKNVLVNGKLDTTRTDTLKPWIPMHDYNGVFDGNGHTISGLYSTGYHCLYDNSRQACGLFGKITHGNLVVKNLGLVDTYFLGGNDIGGFVGDMYGNSLVIANSYFDGVLIGSENVGGLVGSLGDATASATVLASYNLGLVDGDYDVGGLVGLADDVDKLTVLYSYNEGPVKGIQAVGGLVGQGVTENFLIANSYNVGTVTSTKSVNGGLVGDFTFDSVYVYNSYDLGAVVGTDSVGAIYGLKRKKVVLDMDNVYYLEGLPANDSAIAVAADDFANKNLLKRLQSYKNHGLDGSAWTQSDSDKYPVLNKKVTDKFIDSVLAVISAPRSSSSSNVSSSSSAPKSSSSSAPQSSSSSVKSSSSSGAPKSSSSSVQSSSSMPKSSSSLVKSSSSKTSKSSSSSAKSSNSSVKSSSSKTPKSSSSGKVSIEATLALSPVVVHTLGRMVEISGLRVGEGYALMDLQGRLLQRGFANGSTVMLQVAQSGRYLLCIAGRNKIVNVR